MSLPSLLSSQLPSSFPGLTARNVGCARNDVPLLLDVNFALDEGQALRIKGANGVGKSTLLKILCGLRRADVGQVLWQDRQIQGNLDYQQALRFVGHALGHKAVLSIAENWRFSAALQACTLSDADIQALLDTIELPVASNTPVGQLSAGQQRRVALARLFIGSPRLWVLDEPFVSLDIVGQAKLTEWMATFMQQGGAVLFTAHHEVDIDARVLDLTTHAYASQVLSEQQSQAWEQA